MIINYRTLTLLNNILLIVRWPVGGIRTYLRYIYTQIDTDRYRFTIIAPEGPELDVLQQDLSRINAEFVLMSRKFNPISFVKLIYDTVSKGDFDIVHTHGFTSAILALPVTLAKKKTHLMTAHDVLRDEQFIGLKGFFKKKTLNLTLSRVDMVHAVSEDACKNLHKFVPGVKNKTIVVTHGIDVDRFSTDVKRNLRQENGLDENHFIIGFFGRFMSQKGFVHIIEAMKILKKEKSLTKKPVVFAFGSGNYIREERVQIEKHGLEDQFYFLPFEANLASTLKGVDVVAMPSLWEACGLLAMETLVAGVPIIGTNCIGLREVLEGTPATVVDAGDSQGLVSAIRENIKNPHKEEFEKFVPRALERFDSRRSAVGLQEIYQTALEGGGKSEL